MTSVLIAQPLNYSRRGCGLACDTEVLLTINDPWTTSGAIDHGGLLGLGDDDHTQYILVNGSRAFTGAQTFANAAGAINSGSYTLQSQSGVADGASAVGFDFNTSNTLTNAAAIHTRLRNNGSSVLEYYPSATGVSFSGLGTTVKVNFSGVDSTFGDVLFNGLSSLGSLFVQGPSGSFGISPNLGILSSTTATVTFATAYPTANQASCRIDNAYKSFDPVSIAMTVGHLDAIGSGNTTVGKWNGLYLRDNGPVYFGNFADATIKWDATDLVVDPDVKVAGGRLRINSASSWSAIGSGTAPALHANLPTGATGTTQRWLTVKDNAGAIYHIPAWSNA